MHARITWYEGPPDLIDTGLETVQELLRKIRRIPDFPSEIAVAG
jgi:hypothetical protein